MEDDPKQEVCPTCGAPGPPPVFVHYDPLEGIGAIWWAIVVGAIVGAGFVGWLIGRS